MVNFLDVAVFLLSILAPDPNFISVLLLTDSGVMTTFVYKGFD